MSSGSPTTHTPARRIGLSRKRPSPLASTPSTPTTPRLSENPRKKSRLSVSISEQIDETNREEYLKKLENRLAQISDHSELEKDVNMWRSACRQAFIDLKELLNSSGESMSYKDIAERIGIWTVVKERFEDDSELMGDE